jgi:hypothetical protein
MIDKPREGQLVVSKERQKAEVALQVGDGIHLLPSDTYRSRSLTDYQIEEWERLRERQYLISLCWNARFSGKNNPLEEMNISTRIKEDISFEVDYLRALWELIQAGWGVIRAKAKKAKLPFPFSQASELFLAAVQSSVDGTYRMCLRSYQEFSTKKIGKSAKTTAELLEKHLGSATLMSKKETDGDASAKNFQKELHTLIEELKTENTHDWECLSVFYCREACRENPRKHLRLQVKLDDIARAEIEILNRTSTACRRRGEWAEIIQPSFAICNGKKIPAQPDGTYRATN